MTPAIDTIQTLLSLNGAAFFAAWFIMLAVLRVVFIIASRAADIGITGMVHVIAFAKHLLHLKINLASVIFTAFKIHPLQLQHKLYVPVFDPAFCFLPTRYA